MVIIFNSIGGGLFRGFNIFSVNVSTIKPRYQTCKFQYMWCGGYSSLFLFAFIRFSNDMYNVLIRKFFARDDAAINIYAIFPYSQWNQGLRIQVFYHIKFMVHHFYHQKQDKVLAL